MNIIVHHPKDPKDIALLEKKVAQVHAEAVIQYIQKLPCPKNQKIALLNSIKERDLP